MKVKHQLFNYLPCCYSRPLTFHLILQSSHTDENPYQSTVLLTTQCFNSPVLPLSTQLTTKSNISGGGAQNPHSKTC